MHGRSYLCEFKLDVPRQVHTGVKRPSQVCREHGIAEGFLLRWHREYEERGEEAFLPRPPSREEALEAWIAVLERHCGQLSLELAAAKKALSRLQSRSGMR